MKAEMGPERKTKADSVIISPVANENERILKGEEVHLEEDFKKGRFLDLKWERLEYTLVRPAENAEANGWIILVGGFGVTKAQHKTEIFNLAKLGKSVIFVSPTKGTEPSEAEAEFFSKMEGTLPSSIANKAAAVSALLGSLKIEQADMVGYSQGAAVAVGYAGTHPEMIKRLVIDNPAGLIGKISTPGLLGRVLKNAKIEREKEFKDLGQMDPELRQYNKEVWAQYYKNLRRYVWWRATTEIPDITKIDLRPALSTIKQKRLAGGPGPQITLVNSYNDPIFREDEITRNLGDNEQSFIDNWAMYTDKKRTHGKYSPPKAGETQEEYNAPGRDSVLYQIFSRDKKEGDTNAEKIELQNKKVA